MVRRLLCVLSLCVLAPVGCGGRKDVEIGAVLPLSGEAAIYGPSVRRGVETAFQRIQAEPDFDLPLSLQVEDSGSDPEKARQLADQLYSDGALVIIGGVTTREAMQMVPVADRHDRVLLSPSASSPELTAISANFFRVFPSDFLEGTKMGNFAAQTLKAETAVIVAKEEPYAKGIQLVFKGEFERHGGRVLEVVEFPPNTSDFSGLMGRVVTLRPEAAYLAAFGYEIAAMIRELRQRGFAGTMLTTAAFATPEAIAAAGRAADGVFLTQAVFHPESEDPQVRVFVEAFREEFGALPDLYAAHGYDAMMVIAQALRQGGRTPSEFWKGMRSIQAYEGVTGTIQFDEKGDVQKFPRVYVIADGRVADYETEFERRRQELLERLRRLQEERQRATQGARQQPPS